MDEYNPVWIKAFYATSNSGMFDDYPKEALLYFHQEMGATEESLRDFQTRLNHQGKVMALPIGTSSVNLNLSGHRKTS